MVFKFNPEVKEQINSKIWFEEFEIQEDKDGYLQLITNQTITNKLAGWCVTWWDKLEIIEPLELKNYINEMIDSFKQTNNLT